VSPKTVSVTVFVFPGLVALLPHANSQQRYRAATLLLSALVCAEGTANMFGFVKRAHAETRAKIALDQINGLMHNRFGMLGSEVYRDPYVMGYFYLFVGGLLKAHSGNSYSRESNTMSLGRCWEHLTGLPAREFFAATLEMSGGRNAGFSEGCDAGTLFLVLHLGNAKRSNPHVAALLAAAREASPGYQATYGEPQDEMAAAAALAMERDLIGRVATLRRAAP
jgi:hypothetical protein